MDPYSPKSSPRGSATSNPMESGGNPLKLSIALGPGGQKPTIIQKGPFYLMKPDALPRSEITGATNLMASKGLEHSYVKLTSKYTWKSFGEWNDNNFVCCYINLEPRLPTICSFKVNTHVFLILAKKMKDSLSSFLPNLPGVIDTPCSQDNSSLRGLIEKPPG